MADITSVCNTVLKVVLGLGVISLSPVFTGAFGVPVLILSGSLLLLLCLTAFVFLLMALVIPIGGRVIRVVLARVVLARVVLARVVLARVVLARVVLARVVLARVVLARVVLG